MHSPLYKRIYFAILAESYYRYERPSVGNDWLMEHLSSVVPHSHPQEELAQPVLCQASFDLMRLQSVSVEESWRCSWSELGEWSRG